MLHALIINCTLKKSPEPSYTETHIKNALLELRREKVAVEIVRFVDFKMSSDQDIHNYDDEWSQILEKVRSVDIFIIAFPVILEALTTPAEEFLSRLLNDSTLITASGKTIVYNKVAGAIVIEDKDAACRVHAYVTQELIDLGFTIPAQSIVTVKHNQAVQAIFSMVHNLVHIANLLSKTPFPPTNQS